MGLSCSDVVSRLDNDCEPNMAIITKLAKLNVDPMKLVNALISMSYKANEKEYPEIHVAKKKIEKRSKREPKLTAKEKNPPKKNFIIAHLNIGKKELLRPQILISFAGRVAGVRKENIGDIIIRKSGTELEITRQAFNYLMKLEGRDYNGTKIKVKKLNSFSNK